MKKLLGFKKDFESIDKVLALHRHIWSDISWGWKNSPWIFFKFAQKSVLLKFCRIREILKPDFLLILLKCIVLGYSNENESFTGRLFSNYGLLNKLFHFFQYLIYSVFHDTFVKRFIKKLSFLSSNFKNQFQDVIYYWKLECLTL